jgi:hypothetical protein
MKMRIASAAMAAVMGAGLVVAGANPAQARDRDRWDRDRHHSNSTEDAARVGTYALGGLAAYGFLTHNTTLGVIGAAGGALAYSKWKSEVNDRHDDYGRYGYYDRGRYDRGYDRGYDRNGRYDRGRYDSGRYDRDRYDRYDSGRHYRSSRDSRDCR